MRIVCTAGFLLKAACAVATCGAVVGWLLTR